MEIWDHLQQQLAGQSRAGLERALKGAPNGLLDVASNDYLGLSRHPEVIAAACEAAQMYGTGARASRLVSGNLGCHRTLEMALARWKHTEAALVFASGYAANLGLISTLAHANQPTHILCHKRNHASLIDACRLAAAHGATLRYFKDLEKLEKLLQASADPRTLIVVDGVFSMDGDLWDLAGGLELARRHGAVIILDDAHGSGTLGATGRGVTEHFGLDPETVNPQLVVVGTLSKALGGQGGFVAGPQILIDALVGGARSFIYSTGLNPPAAEAALAALQVLLREPDRVGRLQSNARRLRSHLLNNGYQLVASESPSPIVPILLGEPGHATLKSKELEGQGIWCPAIRPPTVAAGTSRLRLTASSEWTRQQWETIEEAFPKVDN